MADELLLLWSESGTRRTFSFNVGGIGTARRTFEFDVLGVPLDIIRTFNFDVIGFLNARRTFAFDVLGAITFRRTFNFDVIGVVLSPGWGTRVPSSGSSGSTTLSSPANAGDGSIVVTSGTGFAVGQWILIGDEYRQITSIS